MSVSREVPDFTVVARRAFESALLRLDPALSAQSFLASRSTDPRVALVLSLVSGVPFRLATRQTGFHRPEGKRALEQFASSSIAYHLSFLDGWKVPCLTHTSAWCFSVKDRRGRPSRLSRFDPRSVWTHLWVDRATGLLAAWTVGPPLPADSSPCITEHPATVVKGAMSLTSSKGSTLDDERLPESDSLAALDAGLVKRVRGQAVVVAVLAAAYNFCRVGESQGTPAMRSGWTDRPLMLEELTDSSTAAW
jgi:hypothetical protein